jgi:hypothetical protein
VGVATACLHFPAERKVVIKPDWKKSLFIRVVCLGVIISVVAVLLRVAL